MKTKRAFAGALLLLVIVALAGCLQTVFPEIPSPVIENQLPEVSFGALHSPNGPQQHAPYEWDIYGVGEDLDGEVVAYIIEVNGDRFELLPAEVGPYGEGMFESETITYQFPHAGWYVLRVTAIDNAGGMSTYMPKNPGFTGRDGQWYVAR